MRQSQRINWMGINTIRILTLLAILLLAAHLKGQQSAVPTQLPASLTGEWYSQNGGQFQVGLYSRGAVYHNQFWQYAAITQNHKKTSLTLKNDLGKTTTLQVQLKSQGIELVPVKDIKQADGKRTNNSILCLRDQSRCKIKHNLPALKNPLFSRDSVYLTYFLLSPNAEQISVTEHQLITHLTSTHFQSVDKNGMLHMAIAVTRPILLEIQLPYRNATSEQVLMLPGTDILLLQTHGKEIHYGGKGALLAREFQGLVKSQHYGPEQDPLVYLLKGNYGNNRPSPTDYKQLMQSIEQKQQAHIDSLFWAKQISPLTHQIDGYNISYAIATALLHYSYYTNQLWPRKNQNETAANPKAKLPKEYFDFLRPLDNDSAFIAPAYWEFIQAFRDPNTKADFPPTETPKLLAFSNVSIAVLSKLLLPLQQLPNPLTAKQRTLLTNYQELKDNEAQTNYASLHRDEIKDLSEQYYSIYVYNTITQHLSDQFKSTFGWQSSITTDLINNGNLTLQFFNQGDKNLPGDYLTGNTTRFHNKFIEEELQRYMMEETKQQATMSRVTISAPNSGVAKNNVNANNINNPYNNKEAWVNIVKSDFITCDTLKKNGLTLIFANNDPHFDPTIKDSMISTFFAVYPKEMAAFNPAADKKVLFVIDSGCPLLAATVENVIRFQPKWFETNPKDYDVVTHETMHIVQHYTKNNYEPRWLTEGIADYVRQIYGLHNAAANWSMTPLNQGMHYTNSYRITARFLYWITEYKDKDFVKKVDAALRGNTYTTAIWKELTGVDLDPLWQEYIKDPTIDLDSLRFF